MQPSSLSIGDAYDLMGLSCGEQFISGAYKGMGVSSIVAGQELAQVNFNLDASLVREYLSAVGDSSEIHAGADLVPYTAVAALGVRTILGGLAIPPGTIHVAQELVSHRAASSGQRVSCTAKVTQASHRRDGTFLVLEFAVNDDAGQPILDGRTTLLVPGQGK